MIAGVIDRPSSPSCKTGSRQLSQQDRRGRLGEINTRHNRSAAEEIFHIVDIDYAAQNPLRKIDPMGLRVTFVEDKWIPFVQCATRFGDGPFREAWDYLKNDDDAWEIRTAGEDQPMPKQSHNIYSSPMTPPGMGSTTNRPGIFGRPGRVWVDDRRELRCTSIVKTIVHEVIEAYKVLSDPSKTASKAHTEVSRIDRDLARNICEQCCRLSDGKMKF